ncbi:MAG TPA: hypothetical protein VD865_02800 [Stenotrophomonas sp.]|nr:hypothetical protein [Stenotrophomonas sp.]
MEQKQPANLEAWEQQLDEIRAQVRIPKGYTPAQLAQFAATPSGREQMVANRTRFASFRMLLAGAVRELAEIDRVLDKALRKGRWGIRA